MHFARLIPLPIAGMLAGYLSFVLASPFVKTLYRPELDSADPASHYTLGTTFALVQHFSFGLLLVGVFVPILLLGRRPFWQVLLMTLVWSFVGGLLSVGFDAMLDSIAINADRSISGKTGTSYRPAGAIVTHFYGFFQAVALALPVALATGATKGRFLRSFIAIALGTVLSEIARNVAGVVIIPMILMGPSGKEPISALAASIPGWQASAIAVGLALGLTMGIVEYATRVGYIRRVYGKNEAKEWELSRSTNRIGTGEVEIRLDSTQGVEPVHAILNSQGNFHVLDSRFGLTYVNGVPVTVQVLKHGDWLKIGDADLQYLAKDSSSRPRREPVPVQSVPEPVQHSALLPLKTSNLVLVDSNGNRYELTPGHHSIGRELGNQLVLGSNSTVSRRHSSISVSPAGIVLRDEGSSNGTFLNGNRLSSSVELQSGDQISFGSASFRVEGKNSS